MEKPIYRSYDQDQELIQLKSHVEDLRTDFNKYRGVMYFLSEMVQENEQPCQHHGNRLAILNTYQPHIKLFELNHETLHRLHRRQINALKTIYKINQRAQQLDNHNTQENHQMLHTQIQRIKETQHRQVELISINNVALNELHHQQLQVIETTPYEQHNPLVKDTPHQKLEERIDYLEEKHRQDIELLETSHATLQRLINDMEQSQPIIMTPPIPRPTHTRIRRSDFMLHFCQMVGQRDDMNTRLHELEILASYTMSEIIASYRSTNLPLFHGRWIDLPGNLKQVASQRLELHAREDIQLAEDHWMADYLMNKQCTQSRWRREPQGNANPVPEFVIAFTGDSYQ